MPAERRVFFVGVVAVLLIATIGATAARTFGFPYYAGSRVGFLRTGIVLNPTGAELIDALARA